jgi:hypothetical protein
MPARLKRALWSKSLLAASAGALIQAGPACRAAETAPAPPAAPRTQAHPAAVPQSAAAAPAVAGGSGRGAQHSPYIAAQHAHSADMNYALQWGIDSMQAHQTNAGNLIRFTYRVVDTNKAKVLIDKAAAPLMISPKANVALQVPVMDKVGALRQSTELVSGKTYWMVFSNKGNLVRPGDHVSVVVGRFRVDGLVVQ